MENSSDRKDKLKTITPIEGIVLDAEGHVLHDPHPGYGHEKYGAGPEFKVAWGSSTSVGTLPKVFLGILFATLIVLGLTVAGIALGVFVVGMIGRLLFTTKRR